MAETTPDTYDPCATFIELRTAYLAVVKGEGVRRVKFRNGDDERETEFSQANVTALKEAMDSAQRECMLQTSGRPTRSAIGIGNQCQVGGRRIY